MGDRGRADEADGLDGRVIEQHVHRVLVAVHHVEHAGGQARLGEDLGDEEAEDGSFSLGLSSTVLPQASALPIIHSGTMAGKLNGVMQATTPTGWRTEWTSTPPETCSERSPLSVWDSPVANSMFSRPRVISPSASERTLPCSLVSRAASSGRRCIRSSRTRKKILVRLARLVARQPGRAACAAAMASSTRAAEASATSFSWAPVAGLKTGP